MGDDPNPTAQPAADAAAERKPVLIVGAGLAGLLMAQVFRREGIPFRVFERDPDFTTRGVGWGLTLNWCLPSLRGLLPEELSAMDNFRNAYVDRAAVEAGEISKFPFFDLDTGEMKSTTPPAPETSRIRVTRERLRKLLATDINVEFDKRFASLEDHGDSITATFEDGTSATGSLLIGSDGGKSRVRSQIFPKETQDLMRTLPIRMLGFKAEYTPKEVAPIRKYDTYFLQGSHSSGAFAYLSFLDAPDNVGNNTGKYACQIILSWPYRPGFYGQQDPIDVPSSNEERYKLFKDMSKSWAEPFKTLVDGVTEATDFKEVKLQDWAPTRDLRSNGRAVVMGDAMHLMTMYRGEGANHALTDPQDFVDHVLPTLKAKPEDTEALRAVLSQYEAAVAMRTRPCVLASRQASLDAHCPEKITAASPLLSRRQMFVEFDNDSQNAGLE